MDIRGFQKRGWVRFGADPAVRAWIRHALPAARRAVGAPDAARAGFDCEGTWFVGVDALANDASGAVAQSGPLCGEAIEFLRRYMDGPLPPLHRAQVSVVYPGYPRPRRHESAQGFRYRQTRDAAHVDGLLPVGGARKRMIREPHAFVLGLPVTCCNDKASPLVVWEGSHVLMRRAFEKALESYPPDMWGDVDLTGIYQAARREVFDSCKRVRIAAKPGESYVLHRHSLHGVAPWEDGAVAPEDGRMIIYFRPEPEGGAQRWMQAD